jgi:hypothetical protein
MARLRVGLIILSLGAALNCGGPSPSSPSTTPPQNPAPPTVSLTGTWAGTTIDPALGTGNIRTTVSQSGSVLSGTWSSTFSDASKNWGGTLNGSVVGSSSVSATLLTSSVPACQYIVTAMLNAAATQIAGTYELGGLLCDFELRGGSISLTKQ